MGLRTRARREPLPVVPEHPMPMRIVVAHGLPGSRLVGIEEPLPPAAFNDLLSRVATQRVSGLLWRAHGEGHVALSSEQAERVEELHVNALAACLVLERLLLACVETLEGVGIPVRALKGSAVGHLDYDDPSERTFGDVDLLVPGDWFDEAASTLESAGHQRRFRQPRPGFDRRFNKGTSFVTGDGLEIDLHRSFTMGPYGVRLHLPDFWERRSTFVLGGREVSALSAEERFIHACYHTVLGETRPRLSALRDVAQISHRHQLDRERLREVMARSGAEPVVARAVRLSWAEFALPDDHPIATWAGTYHYSRRDLSELAAYGEGSSYVTKSLSALRALPTMQDRAAFLYALAMPEGSYDAGRHRNPLRRWQHALAQTRRSRVR